MPRERLAGITRGRLDAGHMEVLVARFVDALVEEAALSPQGVEAQVARLHGNLERRLIACFFLGYLKRIEDRIAYHQRLQIPDRPMG